MNVTVAHADWAWSDSKNYYFNSSLYNAIVSNTTGLIDFYDNTGTYLRTFGRIEIVDKNGTKIRNDDSVPISINLINNSEKAALIVNSTSSGVNFSVVYTFSNRSGIVTEDVELDYTSPKKISSEKVTLFNDPAYNDFDFSNKQESMKLTINKITGNCSTVSKFEKRVEINNKGSNTIKLWVYPTADVKMATLVYDRTGSNYKYEGYIKFPGGKWTEYVWQFTTSGIAGSSGFTPDAVNKYAFFIKDCDLTANNVSIYVGEPRLFNITPYEDQLWGSNNTFTTGPAKSLKYSPRIGKLGFSNTSEKLFMYGDMNGASNIESMWRESGGYAAYIREPSLHTFVSYLNDTGDLTGTNKLYTTTNRTGKVKATVVLEFVKSEPPFLVTKHRWNRAYRGAMAIVGDADEMTPDGVNAVFFGTSNTSSPEYGTKGLKGHNLKFTETIFTSGIRNAKLKAAIDKLYGFGYEIATHTTGSDGSNGTFTKKGLDLFQQYYPFYSWTDHAEGKNCSVNMVDVSCWGSIKSNKTYYIIDYLENVSTMKYVWPDGMLFMGQFAFASPSELPHLSDRVGNTTRSKQLYIYGRDSSKSWNYNNMGFKVYWDEKNISALISREELAIPYIHWMYPPGLYPAYHINTTSGFAEILPEADARFQYMETRMNNGELWIDNSKNIFDYMLNLENVQILNQSADNKTVTLNISNSNNLPMTGVTIKTSAKNVYSVKIGGLYQIYVNGSLAVLPSFDAGEVKTVIVTGDTGYNPSLPQLTMVNADVNIFNAAYDPALDIITIKLNWTGAGLNNSRTLKVKNTQKVFKGTAKWTNQIYGGNILIINSIPLSTTIDTLRQVNMKVIPLSDPINVTIHAWNTSGDYYKRWNESSTSSNIITLHTIGDFPTGRTIQIKRDDTIYGTYQSNDTGYITFTYSGGYSEHQFEAEPIEELHPERDTGIGGHSVTSYIIVGSGIMGTVLLIIGLKSLFSMRKKV